MKEFMHSAHRQGHARDDCRDWDKTRCTLRMAFLPRVTSFNSIWQGCNFQVSVVKYVVMCGNNRRNILAWLKS